jgi:hypothetical protein
VSDHVEVTATIRANDAATPAIEAINRSVAALGKTAAAVGHGFHNMANAGAFGGLHHNVKHLHEGLREAGHGARELLEPMLELAGLAGGFALVKSIESYVSLGESLEKLSVVLGTSVENLGGLHRAAYMADIEIESFDKGLQKLNMNVRSAAQGTNEKLAAAFNKLGISLKGVAEGTRTGVDLLPQLADAYKAQTSAAGLAAFNNLLVGKGLAWMIPLLRGGRKALEEHAHANKEDGEITTENAAAASEFSDKQKELISVFVGMRNQVFGKVLPAFSELLVHFRALMKPLVPELVTAFSEALLGLAHALHDVKPKDVVEGFKTFWGWLKYLVNGVGGFKNALIFLVIYMNGTLISSLLMVGVTFGKLGWIIGVQTVRFVALLSRALIGLTAALFTTPVGWFILAVAAIAAAAYLLYRNWDGVSAFFAGLWKDTTASFHKAQADLDKFSKGYVPRPLLVAWGGVAAYFTFQWGLISGIFKAAADGLRAIGLDIIPDTLIANWRGLSRMFEAAWQGVKDLWAGLPDFFAGMFAGLGRIFTAAAGLLRPSGLLDLPDAIKRRWDSLKGYFRAVLDDISDIFSANRFINWLFKLSESFGGGTFAPAMGGGGATGPLGPRVTPPAGVVPGDETYPPSSNPLTDPVPPWLMDSINRSGRGGRGTPTGPPMMPLPLPSTSGYDPGILGRMGGKVEVSVMLGGNVPPGTTVSARTSGESIAPNVGYSMPLLA